MTTRITIDTPIGGLRLVGDGAALRSVEFVHELDGPDLPDDGEIDPPLRAAAQQLAEYFAGGRTTFELSLAPDVGTEFQRRAWLELRSIPYGRTISYREQAERMGSPTAVRAVGAANGRNPLPIVVPCHRVVGADGTLIGYAGGVDRKRWLLDHERRHAAVRESDADGPVGSADAAIAT